MTANDAAYAVALHRFVVERTKHGERVTQELAEKVAAIAAALGMGPEMTAAELGFQNDLTWPQDAMRRAVDVARASSSGRLVEPLLLALEDLTVADVESYSEPCLGVDW